MLSGVKTIESPSVLLDHLGFHQPQRASSIRLSDYNHLVLFIKSIVRINDKNHECQAKRTRASFHM